MTKDYLSINKKIKIQTKNDQNYYLSGPNDFGRRALFSDSGVLIFASCDVLGLKNGEPLKVVVYDDKSRQSWCSPSEIISITI